MDYEHSSWPFSMFGDAIQFGRHLTTGDTSVWTASISKHLNLRDFSKAKSTHWEQATGTCLFSPVSEAGLHLGRRHLVF